MGLDMYLEGRKFLTTNWEKPEDNTIEDGKRLKGKILELGYWRKHPNLHGFIVNSFAEGEDKCQEIELDSDQLKEIIIAVNAGTLPDTSGFFFGHTDGTEKDEDLKILTK